MIRIKSDAHHLKIIDTLKTGLSANDTKRFICNDGITTIAFGHYDIKAREYSLSNDILLELDQPFTTE
jgi:hypothetical protein